MAAAKALATSLIARVSAPTLINSASQARDGLARERNWLSGAIRNSTMLALVSVSLLYDLKFGQREPDATRAQHSWTLPFGIIFGVAALANLVISSLSYIGLTVHLRKQKAFAETSPLASIFLAVLLLLGAAVAVLQLVDL